MGFVCKKGGGFVLQIDEGRLRYQKWPPGPLSKLRVRNLEVL